MLPEIDTLDAAIKEFDGILKRRLERDVEYFESMTCFTERLAKDERFMEDVIAIMTSRMRKYEKDIEELGAEYEKKLT